MQYFSKILASSTITQIEELRGEKNWIIKPSGRRYGAWRQLYHNFYILNIALKNSSFTCLNLYLFVSSCVRSGVFGASSRHFSNLISKRFFWFPNGKECVISNNAIALTEDFLNHNIPSIEQNLSINLTTALSN